MTRRVLTGMRTTGRLHLGHYVGALQQWLDIVNSGMYDCYFLLADVQALTTHASQPELLTRSVRDVVLDWLSVGLDPNNPNVHFVLQSQVPERFILSQLLSNVARYADVMNNPTLKSELTNQPDATMGFMQYPVDQVADIMMISPTPPAKEDELLVPVGEDQRPHIEFARRLVRRFNREYGLTFVECRELVGEIGRFVGTDGSDKMSKSAGNTIDLADNTAMVTKKVRGMFTDPNRTRADVPGETVNNPVFIYHRAFNPNLSEVRDLTQRYEAGKVGDVEVKNRLARVLNDFLDPIRARRIEFEHVNIREMVMAGTQAAQQLCRPVVEQVAELMHLKYPA